MNAPWVQADIKHLMTEYHWSNHPWIHPSIISTAKYLIFSNIYTDLTIEELLQQLNPLYQLNEIVAGFAQVSNFKDYSESNEV